MNIDRGLDLTLDDMVRQYRAIRKQVWNEATGSENRPDNQKKVRERVLSVCDNARLDRYAAPDALWAKMWRTIRYAGIKASIASREIGELATHFDDYRAFVSPDWDEPGATNASGGRLWTAFMSSSPQAFPAGRRVRNRHKLRKTVRVARALSSFVERNPGVPATKLFAPVGETEPWRAVHQRLHDLGYTGKLTALHLMMDLGLPVVKPDIVLTKLFLAWGWLHAPGLTSRHEPLPSDLSFNDLKGRFLYGDPFMYERVIDLAVQLEVRLAATNQGLREDIGWVSSSPLRELDIFIVKYGQEPDPEWGVTQSLAKRDVRGWSMSRTRVNRCGEVARATSSAD